MLPINSTGSASIPVLARLLPFSCFLSHSPPSFLASAGIPQLSAPSKNKVQQEQQIRCPSKQATTQYCSYRESARKHVKINEVPWLYKNSFTTMMTRSIGKKIACSNPLLTRRTKNSSRWWETRI
jgi:hypothetical protein